ncbi:MAG: fumarate hydratase class II [Bermanella sp.]|jgi:fumarate hydratase class II
MRYSQENDLIRVEQDSMGSIHVPKDALYGAQTQRAFENFQISDLRFSDAFYQAVVRIKKVAAVVNADLGLLEETHKCAIEAACDQLLAGEHRDQFILDIFQTGSGTSTNMNANEVIAHLATQYASKPIHPNNHVNLGQSSNDVIPTAIRIACALEVQQTLLPSIALLKDALLAKGHEYKHVIRTGRTHLMDAMPLSAEQTFAAYAGMLEQITERFIQTLPRLCELPQGGTAVGTGVNAHPEFASRFCASLSKLTGFHFVETPNHVAAQGCADVPLELSAQLKALAMSVYKICNDIRWMNSGPNNGLGEVQLKALQPGSSIMPAKVNPVIEEAVAMVCTHVVGLDASNTMAASSSQFELNVMQPLLAHNLLQAIELLSHGCEHLRDKSIPHIKMNEEKIANDMAKNPILVTALNPIIGYDLAAKIAKQALASGRALIDVAEEMTELSREELVDLLDPKHLCGPAG